MWVVKVARDLESMKCWNGNSLTCDALQARDLVNEVSKPRFAMAGRFCQRARASSPRSVQTTTNISPPTFIRTVIQRGSRRGIILRCQTEWIVQYTFASISEMPCSRILAASFASLTTARSSLHNRWFVANGRIGWRWLV
jgi:hypothetical protein